MRSAVCAGLAFAAGITNACGVLAQSVAVVEPPSGYETSQRTPLISAVIRELARRQDVAEPRSVEASWISELTGYYAAAGSAPLWINENGLTSRAHSVISEIARAGDYGLDPGAFALPPSSPPNLAEAEITLSLAVTKYAWHAHGGRLDPSALSLWIDHEPRAVYASALMSEIAKAADPVDVLRSQHPQHRQFEMLRQAYIKARDGYVEPPAEPLSLGPVIHEGMRNQDVLLVRERLGLATGGPDSDLLDEELAGEISRMMRRAGYKRKRLIDDDVRKVVNSLRPDGEQVAKVDLSKFLVNLERWRTVPHDFGTTYIWNNLPEFETRLVHEGNLVHRERIIIGKPNTQTPLFSDEMSHVIFQPTWGVPPSIKLRQLAPRLRGGDVSVLERRNMKIMDGDRVIRPSYFNWSRVDIRNVPIVQGPGPGNPLGRLKFMFPNAHDVYMHDTPDKHLFNSASRAFSHGCIRVRNPEQFAEAVLGLRRAWSKTDVEAQLKDPETTQINLLMPIPVHNTYFTIVVDEKTSRPRSLADVYGHDRRILDALSGVPIQRIAARDPALAQLKENQELAKRGRNRTAGIFRSASLTAVPKVRPEAKPAKKKFFLFSDND